MKTNVYIDAFNLYYGCLKRTPYRWLNIDRLCRLLLPQNDIRKIKYFTATVSDRPHDPGQSQRQQTYLRALRTLPSVEIHLGHFLSHPVRMPSSTQVQANGRPVMVEVIKTEEKGSDVNIAAHLLMDVFKGHFDVAVVVSNDSDLLTPIQMVRREFRKRVGILNPQTHPSRALLPEVDFFKKIRPGALRASQFPVSLTDAVGTFHKPATW